MIDYVEWITPNNRLCSCGSLVPPQITKKKKPADASFTVFPCICDSFTYFCFSPIRAAAGSESAVAVILRLGDIKPESIFVTQKSNVMPMKMYKRQKKKEKKQREVPMRF